MKKMRNSKFSIIVPIYNVEKYLSECIESLIKQSFDDYEIILIDDGSTDKSPSICDEYAKKYLQIKVFHKENGGLSDARNFGINNAKGEYIIFIDSDDYIADQDFLKKLNKKLTDNQYELIVCGFKKYYEDKQQFDNGKKYNKINNKSEIYSMINQNYFKACAWDKVISKKLILDNNLYFPKGKFSEDIEWCAKVLKSINLNKIGVLNEPVYIYRQRNGSITKKVTEKNIRDMLDMIETEKLKDNHEKSYIINSYLAYEFSVMLGLIGTKNVIVSKEVKNRVYQLKQLLSYNISKKVKLVNIVSKLIGIKNTSKLLGIFIDIKGR